MEGASGVRLHRHCKCDSTGTVSTFTSMNPGDGVLRGGECHGCDVIGRLPQLTRSSLGTVIYIFN